MKKYLFTVALFLVSLSGFGLHTKGGWMYYEYLGPGIVDPTLNRYKITLKLYMICNPNTGQLDNAINFSFFNPNTNALIENVSVPLSDNTNIQNCFAATCNPCISNLPDICYKIVTYDLFKELASNPEGYRISYSRCCRITGINNIVNSSSVGDTWSINIPGTSIASFAPFNSSPKFIANDTAVICADHYFTFNFTAIDPDGDSLVYAFAPAYTGASSAAPSPTTADNPPQSVPYQAPYSASSPMGVDVLIDPVTGIVSGIAPSSGTYVLCAVVREYRNGVFIGQARKSLHITVASCVPIQATLDPVYVTCGDFTRTFSNATPSSSITSYFWDFGDPASGTNDSSTLPNPTHTYSDTGIFYLTLIVNRGQPCTDTAHSKVKVYPGFFPGFRWTGQCVNTAIRFFDTTTTVYGFVDTWRWDFGDPLTNSDTSHFRNPSYVYSNSGTYPVTFIVTNSKGCRDTVISQVPIIATPTITLGFRDTTYCGLDTIQLLSTGSTTGTYSWTPLTNIINPNSANPLVYPTTTTTYKVTFDAGGCTVTDSVIVRPKLDLTASALANPANICEEDTTTLTATSNHSPVSWQWNPTATLLTPNAQTTKAFPATNTTYTVTAQWGNNCVANASKVITVKPLAIPNAGPPAAICPGTSGTQLNASGGDNYLWSPVLGLSNINIPNPQANPGMTTTYSVSVGVTGCSKRRSDSVVVTVRPVPQLTVTHDTLICSIDTLQLNGIGIGSFAWTPNYRINNQNIPDPLVSPQVSTRYYVTLTEQFGCTKSDSVLVNVKYAVSLYAGPDTSICHTDLVQLNPVSDALHYIWTPAAVLSNDTAKYPIANIAVTTTFFVIANIGKCQSTDSITIKVSEFPQANAGLDTTICFGDASQLHATGGSNYSWSPAFFLNNPNIPDPIANPNRTIRYVVTVRDTLGCPKPATDTVVVTVSPKIIADAGPRDTIIVVGQPLQLNGTGGQFYLWSPANGLTNPNVKNPIARGLTQDITYVLKAFTSAGCFSTDTISVIVYKVKSGLYVPNAFTPNGDGYNEVFRPKPIGMKQITYFKVFNRWGQLMFSTTEQNKGWDGKFKGVPQDPAVYVWIVEGIDFQDTRITQKGSMVLIR